MKIIRAVFAATLLTTTASAAEPTAADVGRFIYDPQGEVVGALIAVHADSAIVSDGLMFHPGYHQVSIRISALSIENGRVVLTGMTAAQLEEQPAIITSAR